jgi:hypothetical protein
MARGGKRRGAGRKPIGRAKVAMLVRVSPDVRKRLERDAKRARRSLSREVELQLNDALRVAERGDPPTRALCYLIVHIVSMADSWMAHSECNWRTNRFDFEVFKSAVSQLLNALAPAGALDKGERWQRWARFINVDDAFGDGRLSQRLLDFRAGRLRWSDFRADIEKLSDADVEMTPEKIGEGLANVILSNLTYAREIFGGLWPKVLADHPGWETTRGSVYYAFPQAARDLGLSLGRAK